MSKILIITGGSKGIGKGIIEAYLADDYQIFSIARSVNDELKKVTQLPYDLSKTDGIKQLISELFEKINSNEVEKITLINNAGTLGKIGRIEDIIDIETSVELNTIDPLIIVYSFISLTKTKAHETIVVPFSVCLLRFFDGPKNHNRHHNLSKIKRRPRNQN